MLFKNKFIILLNLLIILIMFVISEQFFSFSNFNFKINYNKNERFEMFNLNYSNYNLNKIAAYYKADFVKVEKLDNVYIYYYFSPLLKKQIVLENSEFNLQLIIKDGNIKICYPINYLSF